MSIIPFQAGIPMINLQLCLEPEAASVYCRHVPFERLQGGRGIGAFQPGTSYMVLDLGGMLVNKVYMLRDKTILLVKHYTQCIITREIHLIHTVSDLGQIRPCAS